MGILLTVLLFLGYINLFSPTDIIYILGFYLLFALALLLIFKTFFRLERSIVWLVVILIFLLLQQLRVNNIINTVILSAILITMETYFRKN